MDHSFEVFVLTLLILILSSCAVDPPKMRSETKISIGKQYKIHGNKKSIIEKFNTNPTFINIDKKSENRVFYFDIILEDKLITFGYKTSIIQESNDIIIINLDSVVNYEIQGRFLKGIEQEDIEYCKTIKNDDLIRIFDDAVIKKLINTNSKLKHKAIINFMY